MHRKEVVCCVSDEVGVVVGEKGRRGQPEVSRPLGENRTWGGGGVEVGEEPFLHACTWAEAPLNERHGTGARSSAARYGEGREGEAGGWGAVGGGSLPVTGVGRLRVGVATAVARRARGAASHPSAVYS
jgi:hypothetical protein